MTFLLLSVFSRRVRQDNVSMERIVGLGACDCTAFVNASTFLDNHCPAVECGASIRGNAVSDFRHLDSRGKVQPVDRDCDCSLAFQEHMMWRLPSTGTVAVPARKHAPTKSFLGANFARNRHAAGSFRRSSSASASRTNPSGSIFASEYRARRCEPFMFTRHNAPPLDSQRIKTERPKPPDASIATSPSGVG